MRFIDAGPPNYKWWALSCTSAGMLLATINSGTLIIALPDLERALRTSLLSLVWVILAYMIASTVLVGSAGRLSDLFGRKKAYVGGFVVFSLASLGAGLSGTGLVLGISKGGLSGWSDPVVIAGLAVGVVLLPAFVLVELKGRAPMLDLSIFRNRLFAAATGAAFINGLSRFALMFVFVFYFQGAQGDDPITAGVKLIPLALGMLIASPIAGVHADRRGSRSLAAAGMLVSA